MAEFTVEEFQVYFKAIASEFKINNVDAYLDSVESDYEFYNQSKDEITNDYLPAKYENKALEYFVLLHFVKYFLDPVMYARQINISLSQHDKIKNVVFYDGEKDVDSIAVSKANIQQLEDDYEKLKSLYIGFGRSILGSDFLIEDFIKNK